MIVDEETITQRIKELNAQYDQACKQLAGLQRTIDSLQQYASHIVSTGDFSKQPLRLSNEAWRKRASEMIKELMKVDKKNYPSFNSVLYTIYIQLRNVYGVVLDQLRKDFRYNHNTLRYPSAFEAISDDESIREIFDSLLIDLFPDGYFEDEVLTAIERGDAYVQVEKPEDVLEKIVTPLAIAMNDNSFGYAETFDRICNHMDCSWKNLQTRYMRRNNLTDSPPRAAIIVDNASVLRKFKKTARELLEKISTS